MLFSLCLIFNNIKKCSRYILTTLLIFVANNLFTLFTADNYIVNFDAISSIMRTMINFVHIHLFEDNTATYYVMGSIVIVVSVLDCRSPGQRFSSDFEHQFVNWNFQNLVLSYTMIAHQNYLAIDH